jgi:hypothetical protein
MVKKINISRYQWYGSAMLVVAGLFKIIFDAFGVRADLLILLTAFYGGYIFNEKEKRK